MTLLSAYHTAPTLGIDGRTGATAYSLHTEATAATVAWLGDRASGADLLAELWNLITSVSGASYSTFALDNSGRLVIVASTAVDIDFDSPSTNLPPEYLGFAPGTTGQQTLSTGTQPYALPYLWGPGAAAAIHDEIPRRVQRTEVTTRRYKHPIVWDDYHDVELQYDYVPVEQVKDWAVETPPGTWSTAEHWLQQAFGPPLLDWVYITEIPSELTPVAAAVEPAPWGTYQLKEVHFDDVLGSSYRETDTPERWRVILEGEDTPG